MGRHADGNSGQGSGYFRGHEGFFRKQERQGPRPESIHQHRSQRGSVAQVIKLVPAVDMNDERIICRTALCREDGQDSFGIERIGAESVNGFCREGNKLPV